MGKYFGTDGFRGIANKNVSAFKAYLIGRYLGGYRKERLKILIARDTRLSGEMLAEALSSGIVSSGSDVVNLGVSTTPSVSYLVSQNNFDFGVMISASHNPFYDNGIKIFNNLGEKISEELELKIEQYIDFGNDDLPLPINDAIGRYLSKDNYLDQYINFLVSKAYPQISSLKILCDCANGSSSAVIEQLIGKLGLDATIINKEPNGTNINDQCGSTHIKNLKEKVLSGNYDIAFAFDGDADRCLAMDRDGNIIDGDAIMFLNALHMRKIKKLSRDSVVITVMSNIGLKKAFTNEHINIVSTSVGDKYVQAEMKKNNYSLGGEQSGHIIFLDDLNTGDGLLTMIKILNCIAYEKKDVKELLKPLTIYPQLLKNVVVPNKDAILNHVGFNNCIKKLEEELNDNGRILVRASGTEPLIRVMCEASSLEICHKICDELVNYINDLI